MRNSRVKRNSKNYKYVPEDGQLTEEFIAERRANRKEKSSSLVFRRAYLLYLVILAILAVVITFRVSDVVVEMSENDLDTIIAHNLVKLTDEQVVQLFEPNADFETAAQAGNNIRSIFESGDYAVKKSEKEDFYNIYHHGKRILSAKVETVKTVNKFGLLHYNVYNFAGVSPVQGVELYHYDITAPDNYVISVNGKELQPDSTEGVEGFLDGADYTDLPSVCRYSVGKLTGIPEVSVLDSEDGMKPVSFDLSEETDLFGDYPVYDSLEAAGCDFDAIDFSEKWSRFLTADLAGGTRGFNTLKPYFIEGSSMYQKARAWATGVDITFVSHHTLDNPPFTDQKVSNVVKYSDDAISADIYLEKHMTLTTRAQRTDVFNSTLYLVKHDGSWKVVNMRGIAE